MLLRLPRPWLTLLGLVLCGCTKTPVSTAPVNGSAPPPPRSRWTLMLYCDCDNDLEEATLRNLQEISKVGSSPDVAMVALVDRSQRKRSKTPSQEEGYSNAPLQNLAPWSDAKLLKIEHLQFEELDDWGEVNMADGKVMSRFLQESQKRYPADHYALVVLDHGDAWAGVCVDDTAPEADDMIRPAELAQAFADAGFSKKKQIDLVVFDACLMANLEMLSAIREQVRLVVASEEIIPDTGLRYSNTLAGLKAGIWKKSDEALRLSKDLVQRNHPALNLDLTHLAVLRLKALGSLKKLVEELAGKLLEKLKTDPKDTWIKLAECRSKSQQFGRSDQPLVPNAEVRDVVDLSQHIAARFPDLGTLCWRIAAAGAQLRVLQVRDKSLPRAQGLTLFFPPQTESAQELASTDYFKLAPAGLKNWSELIRAYTQIERNDETRPVLDKVKSSASEWQEGDFVEIQSRLSRPQDLTKCQYLITQKDLILGSLPSWPEKNSTLLRDDFDGTSLVVTEKSSAAAPRLFCPLESMDEHSNFHKQSQDQLDISVPAQFRREGGSWDEVSLKFRFDLSNETLGGKLIRVQRKGSRAPSTITLRAGDSLRLLYDSVRVGPGLTPSEPIVLTHPDQLVIKPAPLPAGDYLVGYRIEDLEGRRALQTAPLKVNR